ncbi:MAG: DUF4421 domain-containing protein [Muribaculaceae bacterium]|nr:DUF4421 domain-containing protein [Muribaculaceae bacterium]
MKNLKHIILILLVYSSFCLDAIAQEREEEIENKLRQESLKDGDEAAKLVDDVEDYGIDLLGKLMPEHIPVEAKGPDKETEVNPLVYTREQKWWWNVLKRDKKIDLSDTTVIYPKFLKFCVDVYNWGDRFFNSFNPEYVVGTGKRWKARFVSDNWLDSYYLKLPNNINTTMSSDVYANLGAYLQYMAVSVGLSYDIEKLFKKKEPAHKKFEFGFICALFNADLYYHENKGGVNIRRFGDFKAGKLIKEYFPGVEMSTFGFDVYYFFNNKKYSQGAAYNFARYQLKSQGSFMAGISITNQKLNFDFSKLPDNLKPMLPYADQTEYYFHYNSYAVLFGYGYNWVLAPKLLFNVTVMPSVGFSHYYEDSLEGDKYMASLNIQGKMSLTYNLGNYFFGLIGKMNGHLYKRGDYSLFSSIENFSAYIGLRF